MAEIYKSMPIAGTMRLGDEAHSRPHSGGKNQGLKTDGKAYPSNREQDRYIDKRLEKPSEPEMSLGSELISSELIKSAKKEVEQLQEQMALLEKELQHYRTQQSDLEQTSQKKGFDKGYQEGIREAQAQYQRKTEALASVISALDTRITEDVDKLRTGAAQLSYQALLRIVGEHYREPEFLASVIETALQKVVEKRQVTVHLSQADAEVLEQMTEENPIPLTNRVKFVPDQRVKIGGCVIETENGSWDARLETQLERIKDALSKVKTDRSAGE